MEINVRGSGKSYYTPDQVVMTILFSAQNTDYNKVIEMGSSRVLEFMNTILLPLGFKKEDMKTNQFVIQKETTYNKEKEIYEFKEFSYNQNAILKFDYDRKFLSKIIDEMAKMKQTISYKIQFTLKNMNACRKENLTRAYKDAEEQARFIAQAAGKELKECIKTDFNPFSSNHMVSGYTSDDLYCSENSFQQKSISSTMQEVFTPEDIMLSETLYCIWIAE